jgi:hypothetical protein
MGEACCAGATACQMGLACMFANGGSTCETCGGMGQACCPGGNATQRCQMGLTCRFAGGGMGQRCEAATGNPPDASAGN